MSSYAKLATVVIINTIVMFLLTYAMIDGIDHFYANINRAYMAAMMVAPMIIVMLIVMRSMYPDTSLNIGIGVGFAFVFVASLALARTQTPVGDVQFLRSMIPHHSSAIVMCERASLSNPDIVSLCDDIVRAQRSEIAQMKAILQSY